MPASREGLSPGAPSPIGALLCASVSRSAESARYVRRDRLIAPLLTGQVGLVEAGAGFGALALCDLLSRDATADIASTASASSVAGSHFPATARSVIFLFMEGGPSSHVKEKIIVIDSDVQSPASSRGPS